MKLLDLFFLSISVTVELVFASYLSWGAIILETFLWYMRTHFLHQKFQQIVNKVQFPEEAHTVITINETLISHYCQFNGTF